MAKYRPDTRVGEMIEGFLVENDDHISQHVHDLIEDLGDEIEDIEKEYKTANYDLLSEIEVLKERIDDLEYNHEKEVETLNARIEDLENENYELVNREGY